MLLKDHPATLPFTMLRMHTPRETVEKMVAEDLDPKHLDSDPNAPSTSMATTTNATTTATMTTTTTTSTLRRCSTVRTPAQLKPMQSEFVNPLARNGGAVEQESRRRRRRRVSV